MSDTFLSQCLSNQGAQWVLANSMVGVTALPCDGPASHQGVGGIKIFLVTSCYLKQRYNCKRQPDVPHGSHADVLFCYVDGQIKNHSLGVGQYMLM